MAMLTLRGKALAPIGSTWQDLIKANICSVVEQGIVEHGRASATHVGCSGPFLGGGMCAVAEGVRGMMMMTVEAEEGGSTGFQTA